MDHEIPLVPFIDLLLCCIMFLLVTAVWNQLTRLDAHLDGPGEGDVIAPLPPSPLMVRIAHDGVHLSTDAGDRTEIPRTAEGTLDGAALRRHLEARHRSDPGREQVMLMADDGIEYSQLVATLDTFAGSGYLHVTVTAQ